MTSTFAPSTPPRRKALKLATTFQFESISCPGIYLKDRNSDVYLQVNVLGGRYVSCPLPTVVSLVQHVSCAYKVVERAASDYWGKVKG